MQACTNGTLAECEVKFKDGAAACVIMASAGYPEAYEKGYEIKIAPSVIDSVYVAGAVLDGERLLTAGGRVLGVTAVKDNLREAVAEAYKRVELVTFDNAFYRKDIGKRALNALSDN